MQAINQKKSCLKNLTQNQYGDVLLPFTLFIHGYYSSQSSFFFFVEIYGPANNLLDTLFVV